MSDKIIQEMLANQIMDMNFSNGQDTKQLYKTCMNVTKQ